MGSRLNKLTAEQEALIPIVRDEGLRIGLNPLGGEQTFGELCELVRSAYAAAGLSMPVVVAGPWSPVTALYANELGKALLGSGQVRDRVRGQVYDQVAGQVWDQVYDQVGSQVWRQVAGQVRDRVRGQVYGQVAGQVQGQVYGQVQDQVWGQVWDQVYGQVWDQVGDQVYGQVYDQVWRQVLDQVGDQVGDQVSWPSWLYGTHDSGWASWVTYWHRIGILPELPPIIPLLQNTGWSIPQHGLITIGAPPRTIVRDDDNRLHNPTGPAVEYDDGYKLWALHDVRLPTDIADAAVTDQITTEQILAQDNAEVRRVLRERYGASFMMDAGATQVASDEEATIWRLEQPDEDEPLVMVELTDPFESLLDGHRKSYLIRIPPDIAEPRDARLWHMGFEEDEWETVQILAET